MGVDLAKYRSEIGVGNKQYFKDIIL